MIEKLVKEFEKIRVSLVKSKKLIVADIDKIDEKYRRLAQEEKKSLMENLATLNEQLKYYDKMLANEPGGDVEVTDEESANADSASETQNVEEEPVIQDTIFPENNESEEESESEPAKQEDVEQKTNGDDKPVEEPEKKNEEPAIEDIPEVGETNWDDVQNAKTDDDGWPVW